MSPKTVRLIGIAGVIWNLIGVANYLAHVGLFGVATPPPEDAAIMPALVTAAFAIAVFGGTIGSVGLAMLKRWARPMLWLSFAATVIDWGWVLLYGAEPSVPLGTAVLAIALALALIAGRVPLTR